MSSRCASPLLLFACLIQGNSLDATDRYFPDQTATSPNGTYRVDATSPHNVEGPWRRPFQRDFVYTLSDTRTGETLWTRKQSDDFFRDPSPVGLFVSDKGWVVIWNGLDQLIAVTLQGKETGKIGILGGALASGEERRKYVHETTGGPMWGQTYAHFYFADIAGRACFCLRCWWGRRIVFDLAAGTQVSDTSPFSDHLQSLERAFVLDTLRGAVLQRRQQGPSGFTWPGVAPVLRAAYIAGVSQIREAAQFLKELEDIPYVGTTWIGYRQLTLRRVVQLSLRRLGEKPRLYPATQFCREKDGEEVWYPASPPSEPRETHIDKLERGQTAQEVMDLLGAPDFEEPNRWYYEIDAAEPFTIAIRWDPRRIWKIERVSPPEWKSDRWDMEIIHW